MQCVRRRRRGGAAGRRAPPPSSHRLAHAEPPAVHPAWKYFEGFAARRRSSLGLSSFLGGGGNPFASRGGKQQAASSAADPVGAGAGGLFGGRRWGAANPWRRGGEPDSIPEAGASAFGGGHRAMPVVAAAVPPPNYPGGPAGSDPLYGKVYPGGLHSGSGGGGSAASSGAPSPQPPYFRGSSSGGDDEQAAAAAWQRRLGAKGMPADFTELPAPLAQADAAFRAKHASAILAAAAGVPATADAVPGGGSAAPARRRSSSWFNMAFGQWSNALFSGSDSPVRWGPKDSDALLLPL